MRGEHNTHCQESTSARGSSPHARGARSACPARSGRRGIIPACAGSTRPARDQDGRRADHPRMRGEHTLVAASTSLAAGSSPHARGALESDGGEPLAHGIIPACAGSTLCFCPCHDAPRDHPRMRGEHAAAYSSRVWPAGSSPHARGAPARRHGRRGHTGIIPACAGSTSCRRSGSARRGDHPRMRGEHTGRTVAEIAAAGSSPHARGAPERDRREPRCTGIIPACAGSTNFRKCMITWKRDHPRMRGEHRLTV